MRIVRDMLSIGLVLSALLGILILTTDLWLWTAAPTHAYGLIGFAIVDILLTIALLESVNFAVVGAAFASLVQIGAMVGDLLVGQPTGIPSSAFRAYLISDPYYTVLLLIQALIVVVAVASVAKPVLDRHPGWTGRLHRPRR